jgi:hypothetical protein
MTLNGTVDLGEAITLVVWGTVIDDYITFISLATASIPLPDFGTLQLDPSASFLLLFAGPIGFLSKTEIPVTIPDDPAFSGLTFYLQSLVGPDIFDRDAHFTNLLTLAVP